MVWESIFHSAPFNLSNMVILRRVQTDTVKICHTNHRRVGTAHQPAVLGCRVLVAYQWLNRTSSNRPPSSKTVGIAFAHNLQKRIRVSSRTEPPHGTI